MTINAYYDGTVFVPDGPVDASPGDAAIVHLTHDSDREGDTQKQATGCVVMPRETAAEDLPRHANGRADDPVRDAEEAAGSSATGGSGWQGIIDLVQTFETPDDVPTDFAKEHDHYLYGTPKRND